MSFFLRAVLRRPGMWAMSIGILTAVFLAAALPQLRIDNTIPVWIPQDDIQLDRYEKFRRTFGEDNFIVVAYDRVNLNRPTVRRRLGNAQYALEEVPGVARVIGPFQPTPEDDFIVQSQTVRTSWLLSPDRRTVTMYLFPRNALSPQARSQLIHRIRDALSRFDIGVPPLLAGPEAINHYLDTGSRQSFEGLFPVVVLLMGIVLWVALRSLRLVAAILLVEAVASAWTVGVLVLTGHTMNMVLAVLPALLVVVGTAYSLHMATAFQAARSPTPAGRWNLAASETFWPCLLAALTTAAGLGSLVFSDIPPISQLGIFACLGVLISYGLALTLLPAASLLLGEERGRIRKRRVSGGFQIGRILPRGKFDAFRSAVFIASLVLVVIAVFGIQKLTVESHILSFFPKNHPVVRATNMIEKRIMGLTPIEVWLSGPRARFFNGPAIGAFRKMDEAFGKLPHVTAVINPFNARDNWRSLSPEGVAGILQMAFAREPPGDAQPGRIRPKGNELDVRWTLAADTISAEKSVALVSKVKSILSRLTPPGIKPLVTGSVPILVGIQTALVRTQIRTFALSMAVITGLLTLAFGSLRLGLVSLIPNLMPVLFTLGFMGYSGIPLDVSTVTVASVTLGLVVDDTIHFLERYQRNRAKNMPPAESLTDVYQNVGRPIVFTTLAVATGFSAFLAAPFRPTHYFGLLIAGTSLFALVCDLVVLRALIWERA